MKKKDVITVLKRKFMDPNTSATQMRKIKELYQEAKALILADNDEVPKSIENRFRELR